MDRSRKVRIEGNPNQSNLRREDSRIGRERTPDDIPTQDTNTRRGVTLGNVNTITFQSSTVETHGIYKIGPPQRPNIVHDNGFLVLGHTEPTVSDYLALAKWKVMLETAEALRPNLTDALAAYRHFLEGKGAARIFLYERYVQNDQSGRITLRNGLLDIQDAIIKLWQAHPQLAHFSVTGPAIQCGASNQYPYNSTHFPYPATENWQKAIGGHTIWLSAKVNVNKTARPSTYFQAEITLHAEDRYNFNPTQQDITTGIPDSENGRFSRSGLAHQYDQTSILIRLIKWWGTNLGVSSASKTIETRTRRSRQPEENRRWRNRV